MKPRGGIPVTSRAATTAAARSARGDAARIAEVEGDVVRPVVLHEGAGGAEHAPRRLAERDGQEPPLLAQALAGAQEERHTGPAPVLDARAHGDERLGLRGRVDAL